MQRLGPSLARAVDAQTLYTTIEVLPALMLDRGPELGTPGLRSVVPGLRRRRTGRARLRAVPPHHMPVRLAAEGDIAEIFGKPGEGSNFIIGYTREQDHPVCVDLERLVQRSAGVFGASGTGKSFLTRSVLAGLIQMDKASALVLDMHNEYGFDAADSDIRAAVPA